MVEEKSRGPTHLTMAVVMVAVCMVAGTAAYAAFVLSSSGRPLSDDETYSTEYGPTTSVLPNRDPGLSPSSGFGVHPYSVLHLLVNTTGPTSIVVSDPVGFIILNTSAPLNFSYFAVIGGYYTVTYTPLAYNITITETFSVERMELPASQADLESLRGVFIISTALMAIAFLAAMLSIVYLLVGLDRRMKGV